MIRIGNCFFDEGAIESATPKHGDPLASCLYLRSGKTILVDVPIIDVEEALIAAGVIDPENAVEITDDDIAFLQWLSSQGYGYIARDKSGFAYAYVSAPEKNDTHWEPSDVIPAYLISGDLFAWIGSDDPEPTNILTTLGDIISGE